MSKWKDLKTEPIPQSYIDDCSNHPVILYNPRCDCMIDPEIDYPGYPYTLSNPVYAKLNGLKNGYTHWMEFDIMPTPLKLKPCPFCGKTVDINNDDTLYPSGLYWRWDTDGGRCYVAYKNRRPDDNPVWSMNCPESSGGCGAEIFGDIKEEAIQKWNRRTNG